MSGQVLYTGNPTMYRNRPILFLLLVLLIIGYGIGLIFLLLWWIGTKNKKLTITDEKVIFREGILSKKMNEVYLSDIRNVRTSQRMMQRMTKAGTVEISTAGQADIEIAIKGMKNPDEIKKIIDQNRRN